MAVYNGGIRFAPDVYYNIKEDGGDIIVLRNGEEIGGGGSNMLVLHTTQSAPDPESGAITSTLDKTWQEIHDAFVSGTTCIMHAEITYSIPDSQETYTNVLDGAVRFMSDVSDDPGIGTDYPGYAMLIGPFEFNCFSPSEYPFGQLQ